MENTLNNLFTIGIQSLPQTSTCFYSSDEIPEWKNNLFIRKTGYSHIARGVFEDNKVVGEERFLESEGLNSEMSEMGQDGALYAITDSGMVYRIGK